MHMIAWKSGGRSVAAAVQRAVLQATSVAGIPAVCDIKEPR
jgi:hypothetical protein